MINATQLVQLYKYQLNNHVIHSSKQKLWPHFCCFKRKNTKGSQWIDQLQKRSFQHQLKSDTSINTAAAFDPFFEDEALKSDLLAKKTWASLTWAQLLDASITRTGVNGQEVLVPGDFRVGVAAGSTEHRSRSSALHHLELRAHVDVGKTRREQVLCEEKRSAWVFAWQKWKVATTLRPDKHILQHKAQVPKPQAGLGCSNSRSQKVAMSS